MIFNWILAKLKYFFGGIKWEVLSNGNFYLPLVIVTSCAIACNIEYNILMTVLYFPLFVSLSLFAMSDQTMTVRRFYMYGNFFAFLIVSATLILLSDYCVYYAQFLAQSWDMEFLHLKYVNPGLVDQPLLVQLHKLKFYGLGTLVGFTSGVTLYYGADGLALTLILLTNLLLYFCVFISKLFVRVHLRLFLAILFLIAFLLVQFFGSINFFFFYVFFEALLIPMFIMIGVWGSRTRKSFAAYLFFFYTLFGSILMLLAMAYIYVNFGSFNYFDLLLLEPTLTKPARLTLCSFIFLGFAVKVPSFPFHLWLPEAHVEAPTIGSVLLAGILLKLGGYGMVRFLLPIFPVALAELRNAIFTICAVSVLYSAVIGLVQLDLKKIVAYSSITHMNFSLLGLFSDDVLGVEGAIYSMFSHGLISAGLFFLVGALYERYKTRLISYYGGLISVMPIFSAVLFFFVLANVGIPPFSGFLAEILVFLGLAVEANKILAMVVFLSSILMTVNFFWLFNRVCSGPVSRHLTSVSDLGLTEVVASLFLMVFIIAIGLNPGLITQYLHGTVFDILTFSAIARGAL